MFRIRRVHDALRPANRSALEQAQRILRTQFPGLSEKEVAGLDERLRDPFKNRWRSLLYVAENARGRVQAFALMHHALREGFVFLDYIATDPAVKGGGVGGALYEHVRDEARDLGARALFLECLPDDREDVEDPGRLAQNQARLRLYEQYGARPVEGTDYRAPIRPTDREMPHLVHDDLGRGEPLRRDFARRAVRAILERAYGSICPPAYVARVVRSFRDDPVRIRPYRYVRPRTRRPRAAGGQPRRPIDLVVNDRHAIHHVKERGYVEAPVRISRILEGIEPTGLFERLEPGEWPLRHVEAVHDPGFVRYIRRASDAAPLRKAIYPYVFPVRGTHHLPEDISLWAGYYCIDTFTPIHRNVFPAARRAVDCTLTAARRVLEGRRFAYALVRPPGHHAERKNFGGFCYFGNCAIAAHYLSDYGRVAILDIDYHHGNGQQDVFYGRSDVLTISIHGHPRFAYPYFCGFEDERGEGEGLGYNLNLPLPERQDGGEYRRALGRALRAIREYDPEFLVVALGLDTARLDPTGTWSLRPDDFRANGRMIGGLGLPTLVVQEGGYRTRTIGTNAASFFLGLVEGPSS